LAALSNTEPDERSSGSLLVRQDVIRIEHGCLLE
jgi:hypothetical protein